ncbi:SLC25A26 family protein [Megaselia abdita]
MSTENSLYFRSLVSGGVAGLVVDIVLFPIDTVKTRLQSESGFWKTGGFRGVYKGLAPAAAGSAPTAALFFCTYESFKSYLSKASGNQNLPVIHMVSASIAEVVACLIRVPVEIAKQRRQAMFASSEQSAFKILYNSVKAEGVRKGMYRGFGSTIMREIPFSFIQFPLWEYFKSNWTEVTGTALTPVSVALCGAIAGGISAGITTPLDVAKTRIMLSHQVGGKRLGVFKILSGIYKEKGVQGIFAGFTPRVLWITLGGAIFFGFYDLTSRLIDSNRVDNGSSFSV